MCRIVDVLVRLIHGPRKANDNVFVRHNSPATDVVFALISNGYVAARLNDAGSFAPA